MGTVLSWKGRFGWIRSDKKINHEEAAKRGGRVYVHISDVEGRLELQENARVSFFAYADGDGLGAEQVRIEIQNLSHQTNEIAGVATVVKTRAQRSAVPVPNGSGSSGPSQVGVGVPAKTAPPKQLFALSSGVAPKAWPCPKPSVKAKVSPKPAPAPIPTGWDEDRPEPSEPPEAPERPDPVPPVPPKATSGATEGKEATTTRRWRFQGASAPPVDVAAPAAPPAAPAAPPAASASYPSAPKAKATAPKAPSQKDGMTMAAEAAANYTPPPGTVKWWKDLAGDCCPISLSPLEELSVDPFGLIGATENDETLPTEGVWGKAAARLVGEKRSAQSVHWFDGMFLASFLVSSGQLIDPVNRRSLSRGECKSLDEYIQAHGFPAVHVTDAFDLAKAVKSTQSSESSGPAATRMAALEREAASMLRSLFDFRSVGSGGLTRSTEPSQPSQPSQPVQPVQPEVEEVEPEASDANSAAVHWPALGETPEVNRSQGPQGPQGPQGERRIRVCTRRTVHNDGGLQVVDDTEFDVEYEEEDEVSEPTLAESAASAPRRTRLARLPRGRGDGAQITFSVTGRARVDPIPERTRATNSGASQDKESSDEESVASGALEVETWIPDWATPDLHERLLSELEMIEAMFPDEFQVLTPEVKSHLEGCFSKGVVSRAPDPLRLQVSQHLDGPRGGCTVLVEFAMPPFYPLHDANVTLREADDGAAVWIRDGLLNLQATLRTEVLPTLEGSEVVQKVIDWLNMHGPAVLSSAEREAADPKRRARQAEREAEPAPATKAERIEQARKERLSAKFTDKWDLCYAFVKHGSCKDKNCQWRHELPKKEEKEEKSPPKEEAKATKAGAGSGKSTAKAGGKKKR